MVFESKLFYSPRPSPKQRLALSNKNDRFYSLKPFNNGLALPIQSYSIHHLFPVSWFITAFLLFLKACLACFLWRNKTKLVKSLYP